MSYASYSVTVPIYEIKDELGDDVLKELRTQLIITSRRDGWLELVLWELRKRYRIDPDSLRDICRVFLEDST